METKLLRLFALGIFAVVILSGLISAVTLAEWPLTANGVATNVNVNTTAGTFTAGIGISAITFGVDGAFADAWSTGALDASDYFQTSISPKSGFELTVSGINFGERRSLTGIRDYQVQWSKSATFTSPTTIATVNVPDNDLERTGDITGLNINVEDGETLYIRFFGYNAEAGTGTWRINDATLSVVGTVTEFSDDPDEITSCSTTGNPGKLEVKKIDFTNNGFSNKEFGSDDEWFPLDEIEVQIDIENDGNFDVDNIEVAWGLWNTKSNEWVIDIDEEKDFDLRDGDEETITVSFVIDDSDLDVDLDELDDGDNYRLYVTATGEISDKDSPNDGDETCVSDFEPTSIIIESDFVVLDNINLPQTAQCGAAVEVSADVWNIGDRDQDEVSVEVLDLGRSLNIARIVEVGDIDAFDNQKLSFNFDVPRNANEGSYSIVLRVLDEDQDVYENDFDDDPSEFTVPLKVENCGAASVDAVSVSASLVSEAVEGKPLSIKSTITNNLDDDASYTVNAAEFAGFASSVDVDQPVFTLQPGQSKDVVFTFDVKDDAEGTHQFFIEVVSSGEVTRQPVSVTIQPKSVFGLTGNVIGGSAGLWALGALNVILVIIIIIVAIRVARK